MCLYGFITIRSIWAIFGALWRVLCAFAVLLSLSLCAHARYFRPCWLFSLLRVFSVGCVVFVRLWAKFKPLTVAASFPLSLGASSRAVLRSVIRSGGAILPSVVSELLKVYPCPIIYTRVGVRCYYYYLLSKNGLANFNRARWGIIIAVYHSENIYSKS